MVDVRRTLSGLVLWSLVLGLGLPACATDDTEAPNPDPDPIGAAPLDEGSDPGRTDRWAPPGDPPPSADTLCRVDADCPTSWRCAEDDGGEFAQRTCHCEATVEVCDGVDNDCDGEIDEGLSGCCDPGDIRHCGEFSCAPGTQRCGADGTWGACTGGSNRTAELCDGVDNDCSPGTADGAADPAVGNACTPASCTGSGTCTGVISCAPGGVLVCQETVTQPPVGSETGSPDAGGTTIDEGNPDPGNPTVTVTRVLELTPEQIRDSADVKVVLIVDNSASMSEEQARMATGVRRMIESLRTVEDLDLEFYIYTTTSFDARAGAKPTYDRRSHTTWLSDGSIHANGAQPPDWSPYEMSISYDLALPQNGPRRLDFSSTMDAATFAARAADLQAAVAAIGTGGSDYESGFCAMAQTIVGQGDNAFLQEGDTVAFMILSDADDYNFSSWCIASNWARYEARSSESSTTTTDPAEAAWADYRVRSLTYTLRYPWTNPETGAIHPTGNTRTRSFNPAALGIPDTCPASQTECPPALRAHAEQENSDISATSCHYDCGSGWARTLLADDHDLRDNHCTSPVTIDGTTHSNFEALALASSAVFVPGTCNRTLWTRRATTSYSTTASSIEYFYELLPGADGQGNNDPAAALTRTLPRFFGANNFFVSTVINHPSVGPASCTDTSEAVGNRYHTFASGLGTAGRIQSICDDDYSESLSGLASFISNSVQQSFLVDLADGEFIHRVFIARADGTETEVTGDRLRVVGGNLSIVGGDPLLAGDTVRVQIAQQP